MSPEQYRANDSKGRAVIKAAEYMPPREEPDAHYPFWLTTGRVVYHWHTRTKTGRVPALQKAAPTPFVEIGKDDAERLGIRKGGMDQVGSRRGCVQIEGRVSVASLPLRRRGHRADVRSPASGRSRRRPADAATVGGALRHPAPGELHARAATRRGPAARGLRQLAGDSPAGDGRSPRRRGPARLE